MALQGNFKASAAQPKQHIDAMKSSKSTGCLNQPKEQGYYGAALQWFETIKESERPKTAEGPPAVVTDNASIPVLSCQTLQAPRIKKSSR